MSALILPNELPLHVGVNVIVRPGDYSGDGGERALQRMQQMSMPQGSDKLGRPYHQVAGHPLLAPRDWAALTGPCPTCEGREFTEERFGPGSGVLVAPCYDCSDGRRIVPLYTECPDCNGDGERAAVDQDEDTGEAASYPVICFRCGGKGGVLAGRGSIKVVPVVSESDNRYLDPPFIEVTDQGLCLLFANVNDVRNVRQITLDPLPVPGRDFGIVIDCVEVA